MTATSPNTTATFSLLQLSAITGLAIAVATIPSWSATLDLIKDWSQLSQGYGHGVIIFLLFLYLLKQQFLLHPVIYSQAIIQHRASSNWLLLALSLLLSQLLQLTGITLLQQLLMPIIFLLTFTGIAGHRALPAILPATVILYFAIPVWGYLNYPLMDLSVMAVTTMMSLFTFPFSIDGNSVNLPQGEMIIAASCSGLRYFIIGTALAFLMAQLSAISTTQKIVLVLSGMSLALLANWLRVFGLILIGYYSEMQSSLVKDHETYGWIVFMLVMLPLYLGYHRLPALQRDATSVLPPNKNITSINWAKPLSILASLILITLLIKLSLQSANPQRQVQLSPWPSFTQWQVTNIPFDSAPLMTLDKAKATQQQVLMNQNFELVFLQRQLFIAKQTGDDIFPYFATLFPPQQWLQQHANTLLTSNHTRYRRIHLRRKNSNQAWLIYVHFDVGGYSSVHKNLAKLLQFPAQIQANNYSVITLIAQPCHQHCSNSKSQTAFIEQLITSPTVMPLM